MAQGRKKLITALKIGFSIALIYFVVLKIDLEEVLDILKKTKLFYLFPALIFFALSKVLAAFRLNLYFHQIRIPLTQQSNLELYLLGMFYNLFLPGGIGGDAYKGYLIKKNFEVATKRVVSVVVLDRLSGLLLLFIYACILALWLNAQAFTNIKGLFILAILGSISVFWWVNQRFFDYVLPVFWKSLGLSALVQLAQLISVYFILMALYLSAGTVSYLFIFLISSIVAVLPLTIGGIGSREVTFFYGATWLSLDENISVSISMVFFLLTALVSLFGVIYHFKRPHLKTLEE